MPKLHLAHVLLMRGKDDEALAAAAQVEAAPGDPAASYLGSLLAGAAEERRGRLDAAADHYQRAVDTFPEGQFGYIALAEVNARAGRFGAARDVLAKLQDRGSRTREPWLIFAWEGADGVTDILSDVRGEARQ